MIELVKELKRLIKEKEISAETAAIFIGCSGREVRRWIEGKFTPNYSSRLALKQGIRRLRKF